MARLYDIAKVIRSKNSGPFEITLDVLFDNKADYLWVKNSDVITKEVIAQLYHVPIEHITHLVFFDQAYGVKVTFARKISSGTSLDRDVYGAQQHALICNLEIPQEEKQ